MDCSKINTSQQFVWQPSTMKSYELWTTMKSQYMIHFMNDSSFDFDIWLIILSIKLQSIVTNAFIILSSNVLFCLTKIKRFHYDVWHMQAWTFQNKYLDYCSVIRIHATNDLSINWLRCKFRKSYAGAVLPPTPRLHHLHL